LLVWILHTPQIIYTDKKILVLPENRLATDIYFRSGIGLAVSIMLPSEIILLPPKNKEVTAC
jgi:hypothetical protein